MRQLTASSDDVLVYFLLPEVLQSFSLWTPTDTLTLTSSSDILSLLPRLQSTKPKIPEIRH